MKGAANAEAIAPLFERRSAKLAWCRFCRVSIELTATPLAILQAHRDTPIHQSRERYFARLGMEVKGYEGSIARAIVWRVDRWYKCHGCGSKIPGYLEECSGCGRPNADLIGREMMERAADHCVAGWQRDHETTGVPHA